MMNSNRQVNEELFGQDYAVTDAAHDMSSLMDLVAQKGPATEALERSIVNKSKRRKMNPPEQEKKMNEQEFINLDTMYNAIIDGDEEIFPGIYDNFDDDDEIPAVLDFDNTTTQPNTISTASGSKNKKNNNLSLKQLEGKTYFSMQQKRYENDQKSFILVKNNDFNVGCCNSQRKKLKTSPSYNSVISFFKTGGKEKQRYVDISSFSY